MARPRIPVIPPEERIGKLKPKPIDIDMICYWLEHHATLGEIAGSFRVGRDTIQRVVLEEFGCTFEKLKEVFSEAGKLSLRRNQWKLSQRNASMAIFLGKNYLNQTDQAPEKNIYPNNPILKQLLEGIYNKAKDIEENHEDVK